VTKLRTTATQFFTDLKLTLGLRGLRRVVRELFRNGTPALAAQLAYFFILFLFPFLIFLVTLVGIVVENPEAVLQGLATRMEGLLPQEAIELLRDHLARTLRSTSSPVFVFSVLFTLGAGSAATEAIIEAANRFYGVPETRPFWRVRGLAILLIFGFALLIAALGYMVLSPQTGAYLRAALGLPGTFLSLWGALSWVLAFLAVTLALSVLYYVAPNAEIPFKWITPGGFLATVLLLVANQVMIYWVTNIFRYDQLFGQLGAGIVLLIWLYVTGLMVLVGMQINAVLIHTAEERRDTQIVETPDEDP
jgi:membrane protein